MYHELPNGKLVIYDIDLAYMSAGDFEVMRETVEKWAYITKNYPSRQKLMVYWNLEESPAQVIGLPPDSVTPVHGNT